LRRLHDAGDALHVDGNEHLSWSWLGVDQKRQNQKNCENTVHAATLYAVLSDDLIVAEL
jgi:hypothetical protein